MPYTIATPALSERPQLEGAESSSDHAVLKHASSDIIGHFFDK